LPPAIDHAIVGKLPEHGLVRRVFLFDASSEVWLPHVPSSRALRLLFRQPCAAKHASELAGEGPFSLITPTTCAGD